MRNKAWLLILLALTLCLFAAGAVAEVQPPAGDDALVYGVFEDPTGKLLYQTGGLPVTKTRTKGITDSGFRDYVIEQLEACSQEFDVSAYQLSIEEFRKQYIAAINSRPDLFYVMSKVSYYHNSGYVTRIIPWYQYDLADIPAMKTRFNAELNRIVSYASSATTRLGKALLVNDYFCLNYEYDYTYSIYDAYTLFTQKTGVCQAYMLGYRAAMSKLGIPCETATSEEMNHTWNLIQIDGAWYHVDVTWNDPSTGDEQDVPYRARHQYFLSSDNFEGHSGWVDDVEATSTKYDSFFWKSIEVAIPAAGDTLYYVGAGNNGFSRSIMSWNMNSEVYNTIHGFNASWGYPGYYGLVGVSGSLIYYATPTHFYSIDIDGSGEPIAYTPDTAAGRICYGYVKDGVIYYSLSNDPYRPGVRRTYSIIKATAINLEYEELVLEPGDSHKLTYTIAPADSTDPIMWSSSAPEIATVSDTGEVSALAPGEAVITVQGESVSDTCVVDVRVMSKFTLPDDLTTVGAQAFVGADIESVVAGDNLQTIGDRAFADCASLKKVSLGSSVQSIADNAFENCTGVTFVCPEGSYVDSYARSHGFAVVNTEP